MLYEVNAGALRQLGAHLATMSKLDPDGWSDLYSRLHIMPFSFTDRSVAAVTAGAPAVTVMTYRPGTRSPILDHENMFLCLAACHDHLDCKSTSLPYAKSPIPRYCYAMLAQILVVCTSWK